MRTSSWLRPAFANLDDACFLREEQVRGVDVAVREAIDCIMQLGVGSSSLLTKVRSQLVA